MGRRGVRTTIQVFTPLKMPTRLVRIHIAGGSSVSVYIHIASTVPVCNEDTSGLHSRHRMASLLRQVHAAKHNIVYGPMLSFSRHKRRGGRVVCFRVNDRKSKAGPRSFFPAIRSFVKRAKAFLTPSTLGGGKGNYPTNYAISKGRTVKTVTFPRVALTTKTRISCVLLNNVARSPGLTRRTTRVFYAAGRTSTTFRRTGGC